MLILAHFSFNKNYKLFPQLFEQLILPAIIVIRVIIAAPFISLMTLYLLVFLLLMATQFPAVAVFFALVALVMFDFALFNFAMIFVLPAVLPVVIIVLLIIIRVVITVLRVCINNSQRNINGIATAWVRMPNGTIISYGAHGGGAVYPLSIEDANGNFINITYRGNQGPKLGTVTDTMGRVINFNYDSGGNLLTVTAPRMRNQGVNYGLSRSRTLVRLHYKQLQSFNYSFAPGITVAGANAPLVPDAIYYPATNTGYWFGDTDSYSSYGMLTKVVEQRGMSWQASADEQGIVNAGLMTKQALYNYPLATLNETGRTNGVGLSDAPTYTKLTESWAEMDVATPAVTNYDIQQNASPRVTTVTQPNGAVSRQYAFNYSSLPETDPNKYRDGLVYQDETYVPDPNGISVPNLTGTFKLVGKSTVEWQEGDYRAPRPLSIEVFDENNQKFRTEFDYTGGNFNSTRAKSRKGKTALKKLKTNPASKRVAQEQKQQLRSLFRLLKPNLRRKCRAREI